MARTPKLRAVKDGEQPPPPPPPAAQKMTVAEAAASGTYKDLLIATRDRIALTVSSPDCPPRDLAALTRRLTEIGKELAVIAAREAEEAEGIGARTEDEEWEAI